MNCWSFVALLALASAILDTEAYYRVCYMSNWSQYRPSPGNFFPNFTDPSYCTHINFAFAVIDTNNNIRPYEWNDDVSGGLYEQTLALKNKQPDVKILIAVGGGNFGMGQISTMLSSLNNRATFIRSAITFARSKGFDGIDLDFEFPGSGESPAGDKYLFTSLLQEFRSAIDSETLSSGRTVLLLTVAVSAGKVNIDAGYEIPIISQYVDFINLMSYDLNGAWDTMTGLNSPLYHRADELGNADRSTLNLDWAARYWVSNGTPKEKLVIGFALYGRCFTLQDPAQNGLGAPVTGPCRKGTYTREAGFMSYYEICTLLTQGATRVYSDEQQAPYAYLDDQWIGYDDVVSLKGKVDYIKNNGYAGWLAWNIALDDFSGSLGCNAGPFPLLSLISKEMTAEEGAINTAPDAASTSVTTTTTTTPVPTTTSSTNDATTVALTSTTQSGVGTMGFSCTDQPDGNYVNPDNCVSFIVCANEIMTFIACGEGLYYNDVNGNCDWPSSLTSERKLTCGL